MTTPKSRKPPKRSNRAVAGLKRALRPLRPVLLPPWRWIQGLVGTRRSRLIWRSRMRGRLEDVARRVSRRTARIRSLRRYEIEDLASTIPYYRPRRKYMLVASRIATDMIRRRDLRTGLELGPHLRSLIVGADTMELETNPELRAEGHRFVHDATIAPWPVADKAYDLFVAMQVFEHLGSHQREAFSEVRRVARNAMLSLPIDWTMDDPTNSHHQLSRERVLSWFAPVAPTRIVVGNGGPKMRLIFVFEDLPAPDEGAGDDDGGLPAG